MSELKFSQRLRWLRDKHLDLTLEEFGDRVGVSKGYISDLERDVKTSPSRDLITAICNAYSVTPAWLEHGIGEPFSETAAKSSQDSGHVRPRIHFELLSDNTLMEIFEGWARELHEKPQNLTPDRRRKILESMTGINLELDRRHRVSSAPLSADVSKALAGAPEAQRIARESEPKRKAGVPNGGKHGQGGDAG